MFSYIKGILAQKKQSYAVVECGGVGFKIFTSQTSLSDPECAIGTEVVFHTYLYIKEGIMDLYGFLTKEELEMFELLLSVSGVGAKGASAVLSAINPSKLALCIATGNSAEIKKAPGIGNKTAQRIVLELKDKIKNESLVNITSEAFSEEVPVADGEREEAANALVALGYSAAEANRAVSKVSADVSDVEGIIKSALKNLL